ncbi:pre-toxin TG domain-containing protein [Paenibacillus hunanensis]|nr:pre-toxin TG domain-containing protein [Paenibacillus hunanensis]
MQNGMPGSAVDTGEDQGSRVGQDVYGSTEANSLIQEPERAESTNAATTDIATSTTITEDTYGLYGDLHMTYTAHNRLATVNGQTVRYDAEGNMLHGPLNGSMEDYRYDARNRLIEAGGVSYGYDNENNRNAITVDGKTTRFVINPHAMLSQVLMETDAQGTPQAWYVYGLGLISREDAAGHNQTNHYDLRGSTIALTDATGQVTDTYTYDTYGEQLEHIGDSEQPFQYNGRDGVQTDPNGLYQMRARYYNPEIKRFVNRDVVTGSIGNGNPVSYIDPFGLSADGAEWLKQGGSFVADAIPFVGTAKGIQEVFTGVDLITGQQLSVTDRVAAGGGTLLSWLPGGKVAGKWAVKGTVEGGTWLIGKLRKIGKTQVNEIEVAEKQSLRLKLDLQLFAGTRSSLTKKLKIMQQYNYRKWKVRFLMHISIPGMDLRRLWLSNICEQQQV